MTKALSQFNISDSQLTYLITVIINCDFCAVILYTATLNDKNN